VVNLVFYLGQFPAGLLPGGIFRPPRRHLVRAPEQYM
jgi:hypothetical protein